MSGCGGYTTDRKSRRDRPPLDLEDYGVKAPDPVGNSLEFCLQQRESSFSYIHESDRNDGSHPMSCVLLLARTDLVSRIPPEQVTHISASSTPHSRQSPEMEFDQIGIVGLDLTESLPRRSDETLSPDGLLPHAFGIPRFIPRQLFHLTKLLVDEPEVRFVCQMPSPGTIQVKLAKSPRNALGTLVVAGEDGDDLLRSRHGPRDARLLPLTFPAHIPAPRDET